MIENSYRNEKYLISLIKSILFSEKPLEKPKEVLFEEVFRIAKRHNIANMLYYAIVKLENKPNEKLMKLWKQEYSLSIMRDIHQKQEYSLLTKIFEENSIKNVLLKGFELKKLYPKSDMREMSDLDILILDKDRIKVKNILEKLGYNVVRYGKEKDDIYHKKPVMNLEIHHRLFNRSNKKMYDYFLPLSKLERVKKKKGYQYSFSKEDVLIYGISHIVKHFEVSGTGIKSVIDWWLFTKVNIDKMDWDYINLSLKELEIDRFYKTFIELGEVWFEGKKYTNLTQGMEECIFNSGVYGNIDNRALNTVIKNNKKFFITDRIKTLKNMIFIDYPIMCEQYPILKEKKNLLWIYYIKRILELIFFRRKNKLNLIKSVLLKDKSIIEKREKFYRDIGLIK